MMKLFKNFMYTNRTYFADTVTAEFTDRHDYPYYYKGVFMPAGKCFPLKIFSEHNIAFYDIQTDRWYQLIYNKTFLDHWKIVG